MIESVILRSFLVILFIGICSSASDAKWKKVATFVAPNPFFDPYPYGSCAFFFDAKRGLIGSDGYAGILRTNDSGKTWQRCTTPVGFNGEINDIFMYDQLNGWAVLEDDLLSQGLWKTTDGGLTWVTVPTVIGPYTSVYQTPASVIYTSRYALSRLGFSTNGGQSFLTVGADKFNGLNFVDNLRGVASVFSANGGGQAPGNAMWTNDGGLNWFTSNLTTEAWGVYAKKGTSTFIVVGEKIASDPLNFQTVEISDDYGRTWANKGVIQGRTTGHISGVGDVLYVQSYTPLQSPAQNTGMLRSTDGGKSWKAVGGPSNYRDTRFFVTGCLGAVVYAFDEDGGVWKTEDGGDGEIIEAPHNPSINPNQLSLIANVCSSSTGQAVIYNLSCNSLLIDTIAFLDSSDEAISSGALSITKKPTTPFILGSTKSDTILFLWDPSRLSTSKPKTKFLVHLHSVLPDSSQYFDTTIIVNVSSFANQPVISLSDTAVYFDSINICNGIVDTTITFTNDGCDTLHLTGADISGSSDWEILSNDGSLLQLPLGIPRDSTGSLRVRFKPSTTNVQKGSIVLHFIEKGVAKDTTIFIQGSSYRTLNVLVDRTITFPPTSICIYRDSSITIKNNSCDTLIIDSLTNIDVLSFQILSLITLPYHLAPNEALQIPFRFLPRKDTSQVTRFEYSYHIQNQKGKASTTIIGKGIPGEAQFVTTLNQPSIRFADRLSCTPPDSISFNIFNPGCDSLTVTNVTLGGLSIPALSFSVASPLPKTLVQSKDSLRIVLKIDGTTPSNNSGLISIRFVRPDLTSIDTTFTVEAIITSAQKLATLQHYLLDFGTLPYCVTRLDTIIIHNEACPLILVNNISLTGTDYVIVKQPLTPFFLSQNLNDTIVVQFIPTQVGVRSAILSVSTDADINPLKNVLYSANIQPIDKVSFRVEQVNKDIITADSAMMDVIPDIDWKGKGLKTLSFSLAYNSDLLSYAKTLSFSSTIATFVSNVLLLNGDEQLNVHITSPDEIILQRNVPLLRFYFTTALTDTIKTPLLLTQLQLNEGDANYRNCILAPSATGYVGEFILNLICGDKTIKDFMTGKTILFAKAAHPDPINTLLSSSVSFPFTLAKAGNVQFSVYNELGNLMFSDQMNITSSGDYQFSLPASKLVGGVFSYTISYIGDLSGQVRGRFVVLH